MKASRTSTKAKNIKNKKNIKKVSTSSSSAKPKNIPKGKNNVKKKVNNVPKKNVKKVMPNKNIQNKNVQPRKIQNVRKTDDDIIQFNHEVERKYMEALGEEERVIKKKQQKIQNENNEKAERKTLIKPSTILKFTFFIAILIAMGYLMFTFETFNLKNIKVIGNEKYDEQQVVNASSLNIGENIFKQLIKIEKIQLPYVSEQHYGYSFPDTITITIKERYPLYIVKDKNTQKYYKLDNEGYILEECELSQRNEEVIVEGFAFEEEVKPGEKINEVYLHKINIYNNIKTQLEKNKIQGTITKVNFANSLTIVTLDDKLNIVFANDSNLEYKVSFLKGIIQQNSGMVEGTIDMSIDNPVYSKYD